MKYLALIYEQHGSIEQLTDDKLSALYDQHHALQCMSKEDGTFVLANKLANSTTATSIKKKQDEFVLTDGPFAETKEVLAGYYLFECDDMEQALHYAKKIPMVEGTTIEVRPVSAHID